MSAGQMKTNAPSPFPGPLEPKKAKSSAISEGNLGEGEISFHLARDLVSSKKILQGIPVFNKGYLIVFFA